MTGRKDYQSLKLIVSFVWLLGEVLYMSCGFMSHLGV